ncbi:IS6 family transposase [Streptomyces sp. NPDC050388]|uniref:IS6 family transposase n=1 Tax=Streptomyces sp. NPDC050388 TaxID=3155781 RepID=UPI0034178ADA
MEGTAPSYRGFRFPAEIIAHAVWLYHRFPLSYREVEELLLARGITVSHETIRQWCDRFGPQYAAGLRRRRPQGGDTWHLDEVFVKINGVRHYLWRAVDQDGTVLDILVQSKRDAKAAKRFLAKLMKKQRRVPRVLVTDKLRSYGVAHRKLMPSVEHRSHKGLNNRAENSHQPTRRRERAMKYFRSPGAAQKFLAVFSQISPHFRPRRHLMAASEYRAGMHHRFATWNEITDTSAMTTAA